MSAIVELTPFSSLAQMGDALQENDLEEVETLLLNILEATDKKSPDLRKIQGKISLVQSMRQRQRQFDQTASSKEYIY